MPSPARILIVDDDAGIRDLMAEFLVRHGYAVDGAADTEAMDRALDAADYDLVVLDVMMPGEDGLSACRRLAAKAGPAIIMLSAMGEDTDRIVGLEVGADDYLAKPCNPRELLARVRAVLRRRQAPAEAAPADGLRYEFAGWRLDVARRELRAPSGTVINLSGGEYALLRALLDHPRRVLTRDQLLEYARGPASDAFDRAIDVQVSRLRRKLDLEGGGDIVRTLRGEGYMFDAKVVRR